MVVWLKAAVINEEGTLKLFLLDYECHVKDISINVDGGASWLYQGYAIVAYSDNYANPTLHFY